MANERLVASQRERVSAHAERARAALLASAAGSSLDPISRRLRGARLPLPGSERWKYTPVNRVYERILTTLEAPAESAADDEAPPWVLSGAARARPADAQTLVRSAQQIDSQRHPIADAVAIAVSTSHGDKGSGCWTIEVDGDAQLVLDAATATTSWLQVVLAPGAHLTIDERQSPGALGVLRCELAAGARITHSRHASQDRFCWQLLDVELADDASYALHHLSFGSELRRQENHFRLLGHRSSVEIDGALLCGNNHRNDVQTIVEHKGRNSRSRQRYHGIAAGSGKVTVGGRIHIHTGAAGADAQLSNPNLALNEQTEINTKPELEIYEEDVSCSHGATIGKLDEDALFYMRSRGIPEAAAREALLLAFVREGISGPAAERGAAIASAELKQWLAST